MPSLSLALNCLLVAGATLITSPLFNVTTSSSKVAVPLPS